MGLASRIAVVFMPNEVEDVVVLQSPIREETVDRSLLVVEELEG